jgi:hypothetical protein
LAYERAIANIVRANMSPLHRITHGQWWRFTDASGTHWCQTDILIEHDSYDPIIIEAKLRWSRAACEQLTELYEPVVAHALHARPRNVLVCAALANETPRVCNTLCDAFYSIERVPVLHIPRIGESRHLSAEARNALVLP